MNNITLNQAIDLFLERYALKKWSYSTYEHQRRRIDKHIRPVLGDYCFSSVTTEMLEDFYSLKQKEGCTDRVIKEFHKILNGVFREGIKRKLVRDNPCTNIYLSKIKNNKREIWDVDTFLKAVNICEDEDLMLAMHIAFGCTLRISEILALQWDRIDLNSKDPSLYVDRILERIKTDLIESKNEVGILFSFPQDKNNTTTLVLKNPKTESSVRKVYIPETVVKLLRKHKRLQNTWKKSAGYNYQDYNMVFSWKNGKPIERRVIEDRFNKFIKRNKLPKVVFHSLRHTSITYKLILTNGDIKAVQGDSGHSSAKMVTDVYAHIMDNERRKNAVLIEKAFYKKQNNGTIKRKLDNDEVEKLVELLSNILLDNDSK